MGKYFRFPFANQGDKVTVPDETQQNGQVSYNQGYGADYQRTPGTDPQARRIERNRFNQLLFDVTQTLRDYYQQTYPDFITAAVNGGEAYPYPQYAKVRYDAGSGFRVYESLINNNTNLPTVTTAWRLADFTGLDARYGLGSITPLVTGTAAGNIPLIGTPGTDAAGSNSAVMVRSGSNGNGSFWVFSNGFILQRLTTGINGTTPVTINLATSYSGTTYTASYVDIIGGAGQIGSASATPINGSSFTATGSNAGAASGNFIVIGV